MLATARTVLCGRGAQRSELRRICTIVKEKDKRKSPNSEIILRGQ
jgi:hypothetical protein